MRTLTLAAALMGLAAFAGCFDFPVDRWEAGYVGRPRSRETRTVQARTSCRRVYLRFLK